MHSNSLPPPHLARQPPPSSDTSCDFDNVFRHAMEQQQQPMPQFSDDDNEPGPSSKVPRRGTRACDRCRKIKSKCEGTEGERCRNCIAAATACTFQGPNFKRGPPKGYIHAIEQRWHQVECILATLMALPRAQDIVADIRQDPFARTILDKVETGPYGAVGRLQTSVAPGQDRFYSTIMNQSGSSEDRRSKRQSRQSREFVSSQDSHSSAVPTAEWQEQLLRRLTGGVAPGAASPMTPYSASSSEYARYPSYSSSSGPTSPVPAGHSVAIYPGQPPKRKRRIEPSLSSAMQVRHLGRTSRDPSEHPAGEEYDEAIDAFGHLSVDQNQEFRYHGRSAGLHLLAKSGRTDDGEQTQNGIWKFNVQQKMDSTECGCLSFESMNERTQLPDTQTQDRLITLYFTYVHHFFPVIHKSSFLATYYERRSLDDRALGARSSGGRREPMQTVTKLLLLAMFAWAARYSPQSSETADTAKQRLEAGHQYALDARRLLNALYEDSRPSICQALLLLGLREFGIGAMAQGWMYIGMGCRMAIDLGMNRDADRWKDVDGRDLFTPIEKQIRRQIWWSCCIADKLSAVWLGRPVMYRKSDFNTPKPDLNMNEDEELWRPYPRDALGPGFVPMPAGVMTCFREQCKLSFLICEIMTRVYPVKYFEDTPRRALLEDLESRLQQWLINLPESVQYNETGGDDRARLPPHVLVLHIEYHSAVLLLHRSFLPNWSDHSDQRMQTERDHDLTHKQCLDICSASACRISSLLHFYDSTYGLQRAPPLINIFLQSAGIMHVVTLTRRPRDTQATIGLIQTIQAAEALQDVWPQAIRIKNLLKGAKVQMDDLAALSHSAEIPRREETVGADRTSDLQQQQHPLYGLPTTSMPTSSPSSFTMYPGVPTMSMSYVPGYDWWPQLTGPGMTTAAPSSSSSYDFPYHPTTASGANSMGSHGMFTFDQSQMSPDFMQGVGPGPVAGPSGSQRHTGTSPGLISHPHAQHRPYGQGYPPP